MKKTLIILSMLVCVLSVHAQNMKTLFVSMPDSVAPLLTAVNRADCVDFLDSNMKAEVKNRFGKISELKTLTDDYLFMQTTEHSSMEMKLLPMNDTVRVICAVFTACGPACDSRICFYDTQWQELDADDFVRIPSADAFYLPQDASTDADAYADARNKADMTLIKATLSPDDTNLTFVYTTPDYLGKEEREKVEGWLKKEPLVYQWDKKRFSHTEE